MNDPTPKGHSEQFIPFIYPIKKKKKLQKIFQQRNIEFIDVLLNRKSYISKKGISLEKLSELLYFSCKIREISVDDSGFWITKRTVPSAGARHPIDLLISTPAVLSKRKLSHYNPVDHTLNELDISNDILIDFFNEVNKNLPIKRSCLIWFSIQPNKTGSKYLNPQSLYWRDAGALLYCIQLICTYLDCSSCPIGTLAIQSFKNLFEPTDHLISGGGILIGD